MPHGGIVLGKARAKRMDKARSAPTGLTPRRVVIDSEGYAGNRAGQTISGTANRF